MNPLACLRFFIETIMGEIQVKNVSFFEIYTVAENSYLRIPSSTYLVRKNLQKLETAIASESVIFLVCT